MTLFENAPKLNNSLNWYYLDVFSSNHNYYKPDHTFTVDVSQSVPAITRMVLMTKFDDSRIAEWWLYILEKKLSKHLTLANWLKCANAQLDRRAAA